MKRILLTLAAALLAGTAAFSQNTVSFDLNYPTDQVIAPVSVPAGRMLPAEAKTYPVREGYRFGGWFSDAAFTKPYSFGNYIYENTTLYARMTKIGGNDADLTINEGTLTAYSGNGGEVVIPADVKSIDVRTFAKST